MAIVLINPNATESMTDDAVATARAALPGHDIEGWTSYDGPPAIQGDADGAAAIPPLLALVEKANRDGAEAIILACADDTGLVLARDMVPVPVLGIGQAGYALAHLRGRPWAVVTTLPVSVPILLHNVHMGGYGAHCLRVTASNIAVLDLDEDPNAFDRLAAVVMSEKAKGTQTVVLGCAGMTVFRDRLAEVTGLDVIDGVTAAAVLARAILST